MRKRPLLIALAVLTMAACGNQTKRGEAMADSTEIFFVNDDNMDQLEALKAYVKDAQANSGGCADITVKFKGRGPNIKDFVSARLFDDGGSDDEEEGEGRECLGSIASAWTLYLQGKPLDEGCTFIVDTANGYMRYDHQFPEQGTKQMEMCYWNCSDGKHKLVAENIECYDGNGRQVQTECTGWTFFMYDNYTHRMAPVGGDELGFDYDGLPLMGEGISLSIALPRQGKTVVITSQTPSGKTTKRLTWNGSKFIKE